MRNVIVTGASRGIGFGIARTLSASGFNVIAVSRRSSDELDAAIEGSAVSGVGGLGFQAFDLAEISEIRAFVKKLRHEYGDVYGLVNNAGISVSGMLSNTSDDQIERVMQLNVTSPVMLTKYVVRSMLNGGGGRIVNLSSIVGGNGYHGLSVYSATKSSMIGFTRSLARELGPLGITVNAVAPGFVDTDMTEELDPGQRAKIIRRSAMKRMVGVDDVANVVDFLFHDKAKNITGTISTVDAGNTA